MEFLTESHFLEGKLKTSHEQRPVLPILFTCWLSEISQRMSKIMLGRWERCQAQQEGQARGLRGHFRAP